jgi:hypothetical protein
MFPSDTVNLVLELLGCWFLMACVFGLLMFARSQLAELRRLDPDRK